ELLVGKLDEAECRGVVELVARLVRGEPKVVQRVRRPRADADSRALEQSHLDDTRDAALRAGNVIGEVSVVAREHASVVDQLRHLGGDRQLEAALLATQR